MRELHAGETALAFPALRELRPHLASVDELVRRVDGVQRPRWYRVVGAFEAGREAAAAVVLLGAPVGPVQSAGSPRDGRKPSRLTNTRQR